MSSNPILQFSINGVLVTIDLTPFTKFASIGYANALVAANEAYMMCLQWYPKVVLAERQRFGMLELQYKNSGSKGTSGRQSKEHFESTVLYQDQAYTDLLDVKEQLYRLLKEGISTVLSPNMRSWAASNQQAQTSSKPDIPEIDNSYRPYYRPPDGHNQGMGR